MCSNMFPEYVVNVACSLACYQLLSCLPVLLLLSWDKLPSSYSGITYTEIAGQGRPSPHSLLIVSLAVWSLHKSQPLTSGCSADAESLWAERKIGNGEIVRQGTECFNAGTRDSTEQSLDFYAK